MQKVTNRPVYIPKASSFKNQKSSLTTWLTTQQLQQTKVNNQEL